MSAERCSVDTNVFFYALDPLDPVKQTRAKLTLELLLSNSGIFLLQTLSELCGAIARKRRDLFPAARRYVSAAANAFPVAAPSSIDLLQALYANEVHGLQFWDAMLWATAERSGCTVILSEDFQDHRRLGSVTFRNPFLMSKEELKKLFN